MDKMNNGILHQEGGKWVIQYTKHEQVYPRSGRDAGGNEIYDFVDHEIEVESNNQVIFKEGKKVKFNVSEVYVEPPANIHPNRGGYKKIAKIVPELESIHIGEGCYGPNVSVNGQSLFQDEKSTLEDSKNINSLKLKLLKELELLLTTLDMYDLRILAEVVVKRGQWKNTEEDNYSDSCEQCGNCNWGETYNK
jgi:hypothetical protein